ncbi:uncharacterized protein NPIL_543871 [Nephila pilipes]|uniref:CCHC-type domain-containing protein n=1 Tax=Nephila pilipes TaxID=299642 RepID=A0A8X6TT65_NEPPI|nr:uncharacterized protein NPIL_601721 [Nephila pilipes]GFT41611.1 uncharacterized protein NPIL_543871 [Nephila pilipes]
MSVESLRVKQKSLRSSFTMCCTSIEEALKKETTLTDLYALQRQIMDKFTRLDTVQEHILELLLSDDLVSSEYEEDFTKAEKYRDKMNQLSAELENTDPTSEGLDSGRTLDRLMTFLRKEVESEEMILLARTGLGSPQRQKSKATVEEPFLATSAALVNTKGGRSGKQKFCLFCSQCNHWSSDCLIGKKMSLNDKKSILIRNRACFRCLNKGHNARSCRLKMLKCMNCDDKSHHTLLCNKNEEFDLKNETVGATISNSLANQSLITDVYLQTIVLKLCYNNNEMVLRCLLDNGSQQSYLTQRVLSEIKENGILVPDLCNSVNEIDMLLGADVISVILSGRTIKLKSGLIVIGTMLGFTLMGKTSQIVNDNNEISVPTTRERQLNLSDFAKFQRRVKFRAKLLKDLRGRFRKEYLGLLVQKAHKTSRAFKVGEIVLIENPNKKRLYWPLGKVVELIPGRDGKVRTLKLRCNKTEIIRPIQRVFTLEIQSAETAELDVVPLDADAPKIPSANVDVSESTMIPVDAPPNKPKLSS